MTSSFSISLLVSHSPFLPFNVIGSTLRPTTVERSRALPQRPGIHCRTVYGVCGIRRWVSTPSDDCWRRHFFLALWRSEHSAH